MSAEPAAAAAASPSVVRSASAPPSPGGWDALVLAPILVTALVYWPSSNQFFHGDDFYHLYRASDQPLLPFLLQPHAGHVCIALSAVIGICHALFGVDPRGWFTLLVATHLVNVALCFRLIRLGGAGRHGALLGSLMWGLLPAHASSLTWFTMYGQVLASTCILALLGSLLARRGRPPGATRSVAWVLALLVATTAHGAGTAAALAMPVVGLVLLPAHPGRWRTIAVLAAAWPVMLVLASASRALMQVPGILPALGPGLAVRHPAAALQLFIELLQFGTTMPFLGILDPTPSAGTARIVSVVWLVAVGTALVQAGARRRRTMLALLAVAGAVYAATALGRSGSYDFLARAAVPGSVPRYHYLPSATVLVATALAAGVLCRRAPLPEGFVPAVALGMALVFSGTFLQTDWRPDARTDNLHRFRSAQERLRTWIDATAAEVPPAATLRIPNDPLPGIGGMIGDARFPGLAALFVLTEPDDVVDGHRVTFVEPDERTRRLAATWPRMSGLLVAP